MELREQFNSQWHGIRDVVLSEAKREIAISGRVDADQLTAKLHAETGRWQRGEFSQGLWYKEFRSRYPEEAASFAEKAENARLSEPPNNKMPSNWWVYTLFTVLALALGFVLHYKTEANIVEQIFYPMLFFFIAQTVYVPVKDKREGKHIDRITNDLRMQLDGVHRDLAKFIE